MFHAINFISVVCLNHCGLFSWTSKGFKHHVLRNSPFLITTVQLLDHREPLGLVLSGSTLVERGLLLPNTNNWLAERERRSLSCGGCGEHFWIVRTFPKWIPGFFWKSVICILKRFIPTDRGRVCVNASLSLFHKALSALYIDPSGTWDSQSAQSPSSSSQFHFRQTTLPLQGTISFFKEKIYHQTAQI